MKTQILLFLIVSLLIYVQAGENGDAHLVPVDGRQAGWNQTWSLLQKTPQSPRGRHLASLLVESAFKPSWFCKISYIDDKTAASFFSQFTRDHLGDPDPSKVPINSISKTIDLGIALRINKIWVKELLKTSYGPESSDLIFDSTQCYAGAVNNDKPTQYFMGTFDLAVAPDLQWMKAIMEDVKSYATASNIGDEQKVLESLREKVSKAEEYQRKEKRRENNPSK